MVCPNKRNLILLYFTVLHTPYDSNFSPAHNLVMLMNISFEFRGQFARQHFLSRPTKCIKPGSFNIHQAESRILYDSGKEKSLSLF
ncbi:uncharacterized protein BO95DRAFT_187474 [Aspergillus brunneoviolaceus CBS 621.78]|uniref:Uncharacterized protein n=1 Tax=Aspergillus brunneoviolaceus CBS 621.78 TaxID=1450534 RepID=A0ACD1G4M4_9EURO|nr:hypothetical protein BO95DRAFT_187474 [Aspergillus brunneoviolaceus CBS 621.78]RAH44168.1 hypothetical protein BO95DRAFT_187474 [Aspergillus brunneoviolaceus CBS 621.78]